MNWTVIRSNYIWNNYAILCGQLFFFLLDPKIDFGHTHSHIYMYRKLYIYVYHADLRETMMNTLISTYKYLDLELIQILDFDFLSYVFICTSSTNPWPPSNQQPHGLGCLWEWTWNNQKEEKLHEDPPNDLMIIKEQKMHINWILYFCCCSKQPIHVL